MKSLFITLCFFGFISSANQSAPQYEMIMQKNIQMLYNAQTLEEHQAAVNAFERIAQAEPEEWHPWYYHTLGYILMSTRVEAPADKDRYLDRAAESLKKAKDIKPAESELITLEGFIHTMRTAVDPASRGAEYSMLAMQSLGKAVQLNPANPRALYLMAEMQLGTARFFGSDTSEGCATLDRAIALFENAEPVNSLDPTWGEEGARASKQGCQ